MQLNHERPDYTYSLRSADGRSATVNDQILYRSFILTPDQLVKDWPVSSLELLQPADMNAVLDLSPSLILLGTGARQGFPEAAVMAACLTRGIGIEAMTNQAAARTYSVLASERRRVAVALLFDSSGQ